LRVGLVWSGGCSAQFRELWEVRKRRNIPLAKLESLDISGVDFHSLQKGTEGEAQLLALRAASWKGPDIVDHAADLSDFAETAALIENLDLVISVDTSVAHLAAAMGKPTWILNGYDGCWRWLLDRSDSPWYPSVTLFRQSAHDDWSNVVADVGERLRKLTSGEA
jgi:hypothetical protein